MRKGDKKKWPALRLEIWEEREHISDLTGKPLLNRQHPLWNWQFLHVLAHGPYPEYGLNKDNIILALPWEHERQEEFEVFHQKKDELRSQYYKDGHGK
jgi:hypothetical protein